MNKILVIISIASILCSTLLICIIPGVAQEQTGFIKYVLLSTIPLFIIGCLVAITEAHINYKQHDAKGELDDEQSET